MLQGRPRDACTWFERGLSSIASLDESSDNMFLADPQVTMLALLAVQLLHLGLVESARSRLREARALARAGAQPMTQMIAIWFETVFELRLGDAERVAALAGQMQTLVDEFALAQGRTAARWFLGWATARMGKPREGYELIREAYEENTRLGMISGASETLGYAAEALLLAGDSTERARSSTRHCKSPRSTGSGSISHSSCCLRRQSPAAMASRVLPLRPSGARSPRRKCSGRLGSNYLHTWNCSNTAAQRLKTAESSPRSLMSCRKRGAPTAFAKARELLDKANS